jgi:hypothetical protein
MGNNSRQKILDVMKSRRCTLGWDAIVSYNRNKVNALLTQQYIKRYVLNDALPPFGGVIELGGTLKTLSGIVLSPPRLSFENANLDKAEARLTYQLMGAKIVDTAVSDAIDFTYTTKIIDANPAALLTGPKLLMDITLKSNTGEVGKEGDVYFNIADGYNFKGDFTDAEADQLLIGKFFKEWFTEQDEKFRRYSLGHMEAFSNDVMTPKSFKLLTQRDPNGGGSGAVIMFVTLESREGPGAGLPTEDSGMPYFIPDDVDSAGVPLYSAAAIFSSEVIFNRVLMKQLLLDMGNGLTLKYVDHESALNASSGKFSLGEYMLEYDHGGGRDAFFHVQSMEFPFTYGNGSGYSVAAKNNGITVKWAQETVCPFHSNKEWDFPAKDDEVYGNLRVLHDFEVNFRPYIDPATHVVTFERDSTSHLTVEERGHEAVLPANGQQAMAVHQEIESRANTALSGKFNVLKAPDIKTFMVNNLLFPENNNLRISDVDLPGDLALFGQLDTSLTSFQISPLEPRVLAGKTEQFTTSTIQTRRAQTLEWSVKGIDGATSGVGTISAGGLYTAPAAKEFDGSFIRAIVTARDMNGGSSSSTLVTVVASSLSVNPLFQTCATTNEAVILVENLGESEITFTLTSNVDHGSTLTPDPDKAGAYLYNPGTNPKQHITLDTVEFTDTSTGATSRAFILVCWRNLMYGMEIIEHDPEKGVQLALMDSEWGDPEPIEDGLEWTVLGGDGVVDQKGLFKEPEPAALKDGVAVVMARGGTDSHAPFGFIALPLPLERFDRHAPRYAPPRPILQARSARHAAPAKVHTAGKGVNSRDALLSWMQGKTVTYGWNALITYSRAKINRLLEQQYVTKFNTDSFLPPIFGTVSLDPSGAKREMLELSGLVLSAPQISFETADLLDSRVVVTLDIVSGSVAYQSYPDASPAYLKSSFNISVQQQFKVQMEVDLAAVMGEVDQAGHVVIDLGEGYNFTSNLVTLEYPQEQLGLFFKNLFNSQPASDRRYLIGVLDYIGDDMLTPRNFHIRTQAAPSGKNINSSSYGEGGVILFVRTRNDFYDGTLPTPENAATFRYLIPDDETAVPGQPDYSGSIVLSSRMIFENVIKPYLTSYIGRGLSLSSNTPPGSSALLQATNGKFDSGSCHFQADHLLGEQSNFMMSEIYFPFYPNLIISPDNDNLVIKLKDTIRLPYHYKLDIPGWPDNNIRDDVIFNYDSKLTYTLTADPVKNLVTFERTGQTFTHSMHIQNYDYDDNDQLHAEVRWKFEAFIQAEMQKIEDLFFGIELPDLDFYALNHLLFPGQNAFLATEAHLPGDVVLFGQIDPTNTSFTLEPLQSIVKVGDIQRFEVRELTRTAAPITWTVRGIDGSRAQGVIDQTGVFTAPPLQSLEGSAVRNVITASYEDPATGELRTASALVTVVAESMAVAPAMSTLRIRNESTPVELRASSLSGNLLVWRLLDGTPGELEVAVDTLSALYTAPASLQSDMLPALIEIADSGTGEKVLATVLLINANYTLGIEPIFHPGLARNASVQLSVLDDDEDYTYEWNVIAGQGTVDTFGVFTAPDDISSPYSVIECKDVDYPRFRGFGVVHLSNTALRPTWSDFTTFTVKPESPTKMAYANGLQQVQVRIAIKTKPTDSGEETALTTAERASLTLVVAETKEVLPQVDSEGVPIDGSVTRWGVNAKRNEYDFYTSKFPPAQVQEDALDLDGDAKTVYIQTRSDTEIRIAARVTRADNTFFYSTDHSGSEENDAIIVIQPLPVPVYQDSEYHLDVRRAEGLGDPEKDTDFDLYLTTVDYYILRLLSASVQEIIGFKNVAFERAFSMVQWESRQYAEEVGSYTGYALPMSKELNFEPLLYNGIPDAVKPSKVVRDGFESPDGQFLFSLHRRLDFPFDESSELAEPLRMRLIDRYGNPHQLQLSFASFNNRNKLIIKRISND